MTVFTSTNPEQATGNLTWLFQYNVNPEFFESIETLAMATQYKYVVQIMSTPTKYVVEMTDIETKKQVIVARRLVISNELRTSMMALLAGLELISGKESGVLVKVANNKLKHHVESNLALLAQNHRLYPLCRQNKKNKLHNMDLGIAIIKEATRLGLIFKDAPNLQVLERSIKWNDIPLEHDLMYEAFIAEEKNLSRSEIRKRELQQPVRDSLIQSDVQMPIDLNDIQHLQSSQNVVIQQQNSPNQLIGQQNEKIESNQNNRQQSPRKELEIKENQDAQLLAQTLATPQQQIVNKPVILQQKFSDTKKTENVNTTAVGQCVQIEIDNLNKAQVAQLRQVLADFDIVKFVLHE